VVIVLDTAVAGDVPGIDAIKYPLKLGDGPGLMLFDKRYFPNQQLVAALKACAKNSDAPLQFCTMKTGATDGGRYNVMGGGRPVAALCLPTRYLHANSGMISAADYDALFTLVRELLSSLTGKSEILHRLSPGELMLSERQLKIVDILEQQPCPLGELARQTGVSSRTILRDIDYLNFTLSGKARIQPGGNAGYQLDIVDRRGYFQLLQRHDNDDRLLAFLLLNTFTPRVQLASALNLPETWVADRLPRLKQRYERAFCLASRPGVGHFIDEPEEKRIILLANLLKKDPLLIPLPGITRDNIDRLNTACEKLDEFPFISGEYWQVWCWQSTPCVISSPDRGRSVGIYH
jgi:biotin operon repressor